MNAFKSELEKMDVKLGLQGIEFFICYLQQGSQLKSYIQRYTADKYGSTGKAWIDREYAVSILGLGKAREEALIIVKDLYELPRRIKLVELHTSPKLNELNCDCIYRVDFQQILQTALPPQRSLMLH